MGISGHGLYNLESGFVIMRIIHVVSSLEVGGAERFVIDLARQQLTEHTVHVLSMSPSGEPLESEAQEAGLTVHCVPNSGPWAQSKAMRALVKNFDILHVHSSFALPRLLLATRMMGCAPKIIYTRHNERVHKSVKWQLTYWLARTWVSRFVFVAEKSMANFIRQYPNMSSRCETVLNGVVPLAVEPTPSNKLHLGHVGRFVPLKSQHVLVEAVAKLPQSIQAKIVLHFYGTGPEQDKVRALAKQYEPGFTTEFHGHESDRVKIYTSFDVLVVTSETEGLSLAILEALACKMPVIASNVGGNPELVEQGQNGFLYEYGDTQTLSQQIQMLCQDSELQSRLGANSYAKYINAFSMSTCADHYAQVYQQAQN